MTDNRTTELTATERLRALLDGRGVEYETADGWWTSWDTAGASDVGAVVYCEDLGSGLEIRWHTITPEQAIAATLGSEREMALEELVRDMYDVAARGEFDVGEEFRFSERMAKLGVVGEC